MKLTYCLLIISATFINIHTIHSQLPPRDNFVFTFENNFENDQIGRYDHDDYVSDWNLHSSSELHDKEIIDIIVDSDPVRNKVMRGYYPVGTAGPDQHGFLWYSPIAKPCTELYFSYDIRFKPGFQWVLGGKIPGITGGTVSSDHLPTKESGFSVRHMWKEDGALVFYVYHQDQTINYGSTWYYKGINLESGIWYNLTLRVVLNTFSNGTPKSNGILEGFIDGKLIFQKTDLNYRALESISIDNMYISSFFGGSVEDWAATRDEWIDTDNYVAFTYSSKISTVPRGNEPSSFTKPLIHPYLSIDDATWKKSLKSTATSASSISLAWDSYPVPVSYTLERQESGSSTFSKVTTLSYGTKTYTDSNLKNGTSYTYRLKAGSSVSSQVTVSTRSPLIPNAPGGLTSATQTKNSITLTWTDNANNETGFNIQRSASATTGFVQVGTVAANTTSFTDNSLQPGTTYYYRVNATNADGASAFTPAYTVSTKALQPPAAPTGFSSNAQTITSINLTWTDNATNESGFNIYRSLSSSSGFTKIAAVGANTTAYADNGLEIGTKYYYRINAYNADGTSAYTPVLSTSTMALQPPAMPSSFASNVQTKSSITLTWADNAQNEQGFSIWRAASADGEYSEIAKPAANAVSYTNSNLSAGTTYYYKIRAYNDDGVSAFTTALAATTKPLEPPAAPSGLIASHIEYESATLVWKDNATNETGFELVRNLTGETTLVQANIPAGSTSYTDTTLDMNTSYQYKIRALNEDGSSAWSNIITVVTPRLLPPAPPTKLKSTKFTDQSISVTWKDNSSNEDAFVITRSLAADPKSAVNITIHANDTAFTDSSLVSSTTYQYTIKAVNRGGSSSSSNKNVATTLSHAELKRVKDGLIAYYNFGFNPDYIVYDQSGYGDPLNLNILDRSAVNWNKDNTLDMLSNTAIVSLAPATKVIRAIKETGEITFECWLKPAEPGFPISSRIATLSASDAELGFAMDQQLTETANSKELTYHVRMQTASTVSSGYPDFTPDITQPYINLQHLVYTRSAQGKESVYLNGVKSSEGFRPSELTTWNDNYYLRLGNESDMNHSWTGSFYSVALFNKALCADEVMVNYSTGPCDSVEMASVDYSLSITPNPTNKDITVSIIPNNITDYIPQTTIIIRDVYGKLLIEEKVFNPNTSIQQYFDLGGYQAGIYFVQVISGSKQKTAKVILQK